MVEMYSTCCGSAVGPMHSGAGSPCCPGNPTNLFHKGRRAVKGHGSHVEVSLVDVGSGVVGGVNDGGEKQR